MGWSELPAETLALVMAKLPLTCRLGTSTCSALVSKHFLEAAVSATTTLRLKKGECADTDNLQLWLKNRGQGVEQLQIKAAPGTISNIACPKLRKVLLRDSTVDMSPGSQLFQDLTAATQLTGMSFRNVVFQDEPDFLKLFQALPSLQAVELDKLQVTGSMLADTSARLLASWGLPVFCFTDNGMQLLSQFTKLNYLHLHAVRDVTGAGIEALCNLPALTEVYLSGLTCSLNSSTVPSIVKWTSLKALGVSFDVGSAGLDLNVLASMTRLSSVCLVQVSLPTAGLATTAILYMQPEGIHAMQPDAGTQHRL
jgi:hypothetical protein